MKSSLCLLGMFLIASAVTISSAHSSDLLKAMDGRWKGDGWAKRSVGGAREVVRCRLHNTYFPESRELVVSGKCAVPGKKFDFKGAVSSKSGSDVISGRWANPFGFGSTIVKGSGQGNRALLNFTAPDPETKKDVDQQMNWQLSAGGFRITSRVRGGGNTELSDLRFKR